MQREPAVTFRYKCRCGHEFPSHLGKYGCPNCAGENPATLQRIQNKEKRPCPTK